MASVNTYLNFSRKTEEAFNFYKNVFGTEFSTPIGRFRDAPSLEGMPALLDADLDLVMHVALPILGGHLLMGTDAPESMGFNVNMGNNMFIHLNPDTRTETRELFDKLSSGGNVLMELQDMFWGDYYGTCTDKFGVQWLFTCSAPAS